MQDSVAGAMTSAVSEGNALLTSESAHGGTGGTLPVSLAPSPLRRSTRLRVQIPVVVTSLDPQITFFAKAVAVVVNAHGCGIQAPAPLQIGTPILLQTVKGNSTTGRVVGCVPAGTDGKNWVIGVELDLPGNIWGIDSPPPDWQLANEPDDKSLDSAVPSSHTATAGAKLKIWPFSYAPPSASLTKPQSPAAAESNNSAPRPQSFDPPPERTSVLGAVSGPASQIDSQASELSGALSQRLAELRDQILDQVRVEIGRTSVERRAADDAAAAAIDQLRASAEAEISARATALIESNEQRLRALADSLGSELRASGADLDRHRDQILESVDTRAQSANAGQQAALASIAAMRDELARQSAELSATLGSRLESLVTQAKQNLQHAIEQGSHEISSTTNTAAIGLREEIVPGLRSQFHAEIDAALAQLQRAQEQSTQQLHAHSDRLLAEAASHLEKRVEHIVSDILTRIESERLPESLQQELTARIASLIESGEQRLRTSSDSLGSELRASIAAEFGRQHDQILQSLQTRAQAAETGQQAGLASMAAMRDELARQSAQLAATVDAKLNELLAQARHNLERAVEQGGREVSSAADVAAKRLFDEAVPGLRSQFHAEIEAHFAELRQAQEESSQRLRTHSDELTAQAASHLERRVEQLVSEALARIHAQAEQAVSTTDGKRVAELDERVQPVLDRAERVSAELHSLLAALQEESNRARMLSQDFTQQIDQAQSIIRLQQEQARTAVHDALLDAAGQVKGRMQQAVETAELEIQRRVKEAVAQLTLESDATTQRMAGYQDQVREDLNGYAKELQAALTATAQTLLADALKEFQQAEHKTAEQLLKRSQAALIQALESAALAMKVETGSDQGEPDAAPPS